MKKQTKFNPKEQLHSIDDYYCPPEMNKNKEKKFPKNK